MKKIILAAFDRNFAIGSQNRLPWQGHQRADMERFVKLTMGFPLIMGRRTYESFPRRPLPGRTNIVVTHQPEYDLLEPGCVPASSCEAALEIASQDNKDWVFIIGGAEIYRQMLPKADELEITVIDHEFAADAFFPAINPNTWFKVSEVHHDPDKLNRYGYSFLKFERRV